MKKYLTIFRIGIQENFEYRSEFFISIIAWGIRLLISVFLYSAIFRSNAQIGDFNLQKMMTYFLVVQIFMSLNFARTGVTISDDVQTGDFSNFMVKPVSYISYQIILEFSKNIVKFIMSLAIFGAVIAWYNPVILPELGRNMPLAIISSLIASIMGSLISMCIGVFAFWIVSARRIIFMYFAIYSIFSGMLIPLNLFPETIQKIIFATPLPYILYVPTQMALGGYSGQEAMMMLLRQCGFTITLFFLAKTLFIFGVKKYEAVGR